MRANRIVALVVAAIVSVTAVGCSTPNPASTPPKEDGNAAGVDLAYVKEQIEKFTSTPVFEPPAGPIDVSKVKGKKIYTVPNSSTVPICAAVNERMAEQAKKLGIEYQTYTTSGQQAEWVSGFNAAISAKADLINAFCGLETKRIAPQVKQAVDAGIPVVASHTEVVGQEHLDTLAALIYAPYVQVATLMADWVIYDTKGKANVLLITTPSTGSSPFMEKAFKDEMEARCSSCKVSYFGVPVQDWGSTIDPKVRAEITSNPDLNYIVPIYDAMIQFVMPAITATGSTDRVHIASYNATPSVLDQMRNSETVRFDIGEDVYWLADAILDQNMRVLLGMEPIKDYSVGLRAFTKDNVEEAGVPAQLGKGYGDSASKGYAKLWGLN